jgi:hypothetical protein
MPWVAQSALDEMVALLRDVREGRLVRAGERRGVRKPSGAKKGVAPAVADQSRERSPAPSTADLPEQDAGLPDAIVAACAEFAFGEPDERERNMRMAHELFRAKKSPAEILQAIRRGADPELFV